MTTFYRRLRLRYGMLWNTGKNTDWTFIALVCLLVALHFCIVEVIYLRQDNAELQLEVSKLQEKLDLANARIASCLNGGPVGFTREKGKNLWVSCAKPTLVEVEES